MRKLLLIIAVLFGFIGAKAQNPFAEYGYTPKIATLSQGQFNEFFDNDTIVHIGSVLYNTKSREIVGFIKFDTIYSEATLQPEIVSRWISPDPLASKYPSNSPYNYVSNNPIIKLDPDGRDEFIFHHNYRNSQKVKLSDGKNVFNIPQYDIRIPKPGMHTYWMQWNAEPRFANSNSDKIGEFMFNQTNYIQINSPMTIQGGDGHDGFSSLQELNVYGMVDEMVNSWKQEVGWSKEGLLNPKNLIAFKNASGNKGDFDFKFQLKLDPNTLYEINGVYYNANEAGNFYWGYVAGLLNISGADMNFGAQEFVNRQGRSFDEPWEVDSFIDGWFFRLSNTRSDIYDNYSKSRSNTDMYNGN